MIGQAFAGLVILTGMLLVGGLVAVAYGLVRAHPALADGLAQLDPTGPGQQSRSVPIATSTSERAGLWLYRRTPIPLSVRQLRLLELRNKPIAEFFADKLVLALIGLMLPGLVGFMVMLVTGLPVGIPVLAGVLGLIAGYFVPDLQLARGGEQTRTDAREALFTFFDLVSLERMANLSATQALESAAAASDSPLFVSIRGALLRARLEQRPPYAELRRLADRLQLPQLADIADVMQLDETGAAVTTTLRARVRELRDAHLTEAQVAAHAVSERMTIFMAIPAMVFGLIFLTPPLLRLVGT